ncbi:tail completion or Neck1 protein [Ralstonia phage PQ43W]
MSVKRRGLRITKRYPTMSVKAGVLAGATYPADTLTDARTGAKYPDPRAGMAVAVIAAALEYGERQNHPRPFMQMTVTRERATWTQALTTLLMRQVPVQAALQTVGQVMKEDIRYTITEWPADNSKAWAAKKGFDHGLIQTSHLMNSIESEIEGAT